MLKSIQFAIVLSLSLVVVSCNSGTSQDEKAETTTTDKAQGVYQDINVAEFDKLRADDSYVVIDVRTPREIAAGKIPGAIEMDFHGKTFKQDLSKLPKDTKYLVYCKVGGRSGTAAKQMIGYGFEYVSNLAGGYDKWSVAHKD